tara:strand:- start:686 stop:883 length:198 start_codon:yes stop_codon:yes gene_type:complete
VTKILNIYIEFFFVDFELYLLSDISEINNLKYEQSEIYKSLIKDWKSFVKANRIILPTPYRDDLN